MLTELERAARAAAQRKAAEGYEPRDPIMGGLRFQRRGAPPGMLILLACLIALVIVGLGASYFRTVPPAHILIVVLGLFCLFGWRFRKGRKGGTR